MGNSGNSDNSYSSSESHDAQEEIENSHRRARNQNRPLHGVDSKGPPRDLAKFAKGTFNPLKPLLIYVTRLPKKIQKLVVAHVIGSAIFVGITLLAAIPG